MQKVAAVKVDSYDYNYDDVEKRAFKNSFLYWMD